MTDLAGAWRLARRSVVTLGLSLVVVAMLVASYSLSPIAGWIPRIVLVVTLALLVIQLGIDVRGRLRNPPSTPGVGRNSVRATALRVASAAEAVAVLWAAGALMALLLFGMIAGSAVFAFAFLRGYAGERWLGSAVFALALAAGLQLVFGTVLNATLYSGWLWQFLG
jgi:hypothetical protein